MEIRDDGDLVAAAWGVAAESVYGGPGWLESDRFDIIAKAPPDSSESERALMLRALLAERFKLAVHRDTNPLTVFGLTEVKRSPQLKEASGKGPPDCKQETEQGPPFFLIYSCHDLSMSEFAARLRDMDGASVSSPSIDLTNLKGRWDMTIQFTPRQMLPE